MARHTVTFEEMSTYIGQDGWDIAAASSGRDPHTSKRLEFSRKGMFRVTNRDEVTYEGASLGLAVDAYNEAP